MRKLPQGKELNAQQRVGGLMFRSRTSYSLLLAGLATAAVAATTHTVVKGDTLWDITGKYLGNPFQWNQVWSRNPQIKDAHWIYPGDVIRLGAPEAGSAAGAGAGAGDSATAVGVTDSAGGIDTSSVLSEFPLGPDFQTFVRLDTQSVVQLVTPPAQSVLNPEAVLVAPVLLQPGEAVDANRSKLDWVIEGGRHQLRPGTLVGGVMPSSMGLKVGDLLEVVETGELVMPLQLKDSKKDVHPRFEQTRALVAVVEVRGDSLQCLTRKVYGSIGPKAVLRPLTKVQTQKVTGFAVDSQSLQATVVGNNRPSAIQLPGSFLVLDRGENQGVQQGDIFEIMARGLPRSMAGMRGYGIVVRTAQQSATLFLVGVSSRAIQVGDRAYRIRRPLSD